MPFKIALAVVLAAAMLVPAGPIGGDQSVRASSGPERVFFSDTGQYLEGAFLEFWWEHGGVPVFGFPVSGEFDQDGMTVQYFERAVLEAHPDNPPEWQILLRRLGAQAATPEIREHEAFEPSPEADSGLYFENTQQNLQAGFLEHWEKHGGIRIFGYPISSEFKPDDLTVQYFERAIFEYHPDHPPEWRVLQPLIGAAAARDDEVDTSPQEPDEDVPEYHPNLWKHPPPGERIVYLTFDDGPHPVWTPQILDILGQYNAPATFFVLGEYAQQHPRIIDDIANRGHTLGNHSFNHSSMAGMSFAQFQWQVQATENAVGGGRMARCLRPPYGAMDGNTRGFASQLGYEIVLWDVDPNDWQRPGAGVIADRVVHNVRPGAIVLLHDGGANRAQTVDALRMIMQRLSDQGYRFGALCN